MLSRVRTIAFIGMRPVEITVEAQISPGIASFTIVGLPDKAVAEAKERVRSTFFHLGIGFPPKRVVINMAPADMPKGGSHYDLPIAIAILGSMGAIDIDFFNNAITIGELSLDGRLQYVSGTLCAAMFANEKGMSIICPSDCSDEAVLSGNNSIIAPDSMLSLINHIKGTSIIKQPTMDQNSVRQQQYSIDMSDIKGQEVAKRAIMIAVSGRHNVLMIGQPGAGKSMMAHRIQTILPPLSPQEALETTCIYSIAGMMQDKRLISVPPFRDPHNSASIASMVGGGTDVKPGEISLAHNGILFMDELPEFQKTVIEALRQPLETNNVTIARAKEHITYPASIQLVAAMNPCKCGHYGNRQKECPKVPKCAMDYKNKISGPILDRFDMVIYMNSIKTEDLFNSQQCMESSEMKKIVTRARNYQESRYREMNPDSKRDIFGIGYDVCNTSENSSHYNGKISNKYLDTISNIDDEARSLIQHAVSSANLSARGCNKIIRVARTIADMSQSTKITDSHIAEALQYRMIDPINSIK